MIKVNGPLVEITGTIPEMMVETTGVLIALYRSLRKSMDEDKANEAFALVGRAAVDTALDDKSVLSLAECMFERGKKMVQYANQNGDCIINVGGGYFRPIPGKDDEDADYYFARELHRAREILYKRKRMREAYENRKEIING